MRGLDGLKPLRCRLHSRHWASCAEGTEDTDNVEAVEGGEACEDRSDDEDEDDTEDAIEDYGNQLPYNFDRCAWKTRLNSQEFLILGNTVHHSYPSPNVWPYTNGRSTNQV